MNCLFLQNFNFGSLLLMDFKERPVVISVQLHL
jgi:hypothetical protein